MIFKTGRGSREGDAEPEAEPRMLFFVVVDDIFIFWVLCFVT